ncbi:MAG: dihydropteroate synthase [Pelagibacteraceae bacterium]|nr:dihydropteroate synthase [Pelagibacteraceae bacterium]
MFINIIDIGGESTRPESKIVDENEEWKRIKTLLLNVKKISKSTLYP